MFAIKSLLVIFRKNIYSFLFHIKSVQLSIESSHNTTNTPNSLVSAQTFSITNTIVLHRFPYFFLHMIVERMFEGDENDLYAEDLHENDDSDDTYSNSVVDEANENEADVAEDDHAGTNPISKTFAAVQRHYEPLVFGPERLFESSKL